MSYLKLFFCIYSRYFLKTGGGSSSRTYAGLSGTLQNDAKVMPKLFHTLFGKVDFGSRNDALQLQHAGFTLQLQLQLLLLLLSNYYYYYYYYCYCSYSYSYPYYYYYYYYYYCYY